MAVSIKLSLINLLCVWIYISASTSTPLEAMSWVINEGAGFPARSHLLHGVQDLTPVLAALYAHLHYNQSMWTQKYPQFLWLFPPTCFIWFLWFLSLLFVLVQHMNDGKLVIYEVIWIFDPVPRRWVWHLQGYWSFMEVVHKARKERLVFIILHINILHSSSCCGNVIWNIYLLPILNFMTSSRTKKYGVRINRMFFFAVYTFYHIIFKCAKTCI